MAFLRQCLYEMRLRTGYFLPNSPMIVTQPVMMHATRNLHLTLLPPPCERLPLNQDLTITNSCSESAHT